MRFSEPELIGLLRDMLRRFVARELPRAQAAQWNKINHVPREIFAKLAGLGIMGLIVPQQYGGAGRDVLATIIVIDELSMRSLAVSVPYIMAACHADRNLVECASPAS